MWSICPLWPEVLQNTFILPGPQPLQSGCQQMFLPCIIICPPVAHLSPQSWKLGIWRGHTTASCFPGILNPLWFSQRSLGGLLSGPDVPSVLTTIVMRLHSIRIYSVIWKQNPSCNQVANGAGIEQAAGVCLLCSYVTGHNLLFLSGTHVWYDKGGLNTSFLSQTLLRSLSIKHRERLFRLKEEDQMALGWTLRYFWGTQGSWGPGLRTWLEMSLSSP